MAVAGRRRRGADVRLHRAVLARAVHSGRARGRRRTRSRRCSSRRSPCWPRSRSRAASSSAPFAGLAADAATGHARRRRSTSPRPTTSTPRPENVMAAGRVGARRGCCSSRGARARGVAGAVARSGRTSRAAADGTARRCAALQRVSPTGSTTPRCATCAPASRRCSSRPACSIALGFAFTPTRGLVHASATVAVGDLPIVVLLVLVRGRGVHGRPRTRAGCAPSSRSRCSGFALAAVYAVVGRAGRRARGGRGRDDLHARVRRRVLARCRQPRRAGARRPRRRRAATCVAGVGRGRWRVRRDLGDALAHEPARPADAAEHDRADAATRTAATWSR